MKRWLIILLAAGFCIAAMLRWRELKDFGSQIFYEYGEADAPDGELFDRMAEAERSQGNPLPDRAAWTVEENVEVENRSLGRVQKADRMLVWGDRELAVKRGLAAGNYGYPSDPRACVISRGLAMELFGSYAVVGMEVRCQGTDYLVRGVTQDDRRMVIVPASGSSDRFPYVLLDYGADRGAKSGADQLLYRYDAGSARYRVDGEICLSVAGFLHFCRCGRPWDGACLSILSGRNASCTGWPQCRRRRWQRRPVSGFWGRRKPGFRRTSSPPDGRISASGASGGGRSLRRCALRGRTVASCG